MAAESTVLRRTATGVFVFGLVVFLAALYVGLVFFDNTLDAGSGTVSRLDLVDWVVLFSILLVLVLIALLILYFLPTPEAREEVAEPSEWEPAQPAEDTSPLVVEELPEPETPPAPFVVEEVEEVEEPRSAEAITEALLVRCTNCDTEFELPYTTERPLQGVCPTCHEEVVLEEGEDVLSSETDDVIDIEGIGPKYAAKLRKAGVSTTGQLRRARTDRLAAETGIEETMLDTWKSMADLMRVEGVDNQYAELLTRTGVYSVDELARESPSRLFKRIKTYIGTLERAPTDKPLSEKRCEAWIEAAQNVSGH